MKARDRKLRKQLRAVKLQMRGYEAQVEQCQRDIVEMRTAMAGAGAVLNLDNRPGPGHSPART